MKKMWSLLFAVIATVLTAGDADQVRERLKNDPYMIPFYTGQILPAPQKVTYQQDFYPLTNTGILLGKELKPDDSLGETADRPYHQLWRQI